MAYQSDDYDAYPAAVHIQSSEHESAEHAYSSSAADIPQSSAWQHPSERSKKLYQRSALGALILLSLALLTYYVTDLGGIKAPLHSHRSGPTERSHWHDEQDAIVFTDVEGLALPGDEMVLTQRHHHHHHDEMHSHDTSKHHSQHHDSHHTSASASPTKEKTKGSNDDIDWESSKASTGQGYVQQAPGSSAAKNPSPFNTKACEGPFPGYPYCQEKMDWLKDNWNADSDSEAYYRSQNVDGTKCSFLNYLNLHGFYCPEARDAGRAKIRGVNLGGWLVLEPWIVPSLFDQFGKHDNVMDMWQWCEKLGKTEAKRQLKEHWDTFVTEDDIRTLAHSGIDHIRIPFGYWLMGDIQDDEPWVEGDLYYLDRAIKWAHQYGMHVMLDLHTGPGSQNGFDNSGRKGEIHWADTDTTSEGRVVYPNIERTLKVLDSVVKHYSDSEFYSTVVAIELINEAFITIPIEVVKDFYLRGYEVVKKYATTENDIAVVIGDSFRFGAWGNFMFPPHYRHVWIDTHIYQVFDSMRLQYTWEEHITQTCTVNKPEVMVAPLSTLVGEWSLATTDCAKYLNSFGAGARYDGTLEGYDKVGDCTGQDDMNDHSVWTPEYRSFLRRWAELQMDAYESGSSAGWFFWNFKTEEAPQWNYLLGLKQGWIPSDHAARHYRC